MAKKGKRHVRERSDVHDEETIRRRRTGELVFVNRQELVARILEIVIELWFGNRDQVSIHILACVAHQNLDKIAKYKGLPGPTLKQREKWDVIYSAYDAFRHWNGDPDHQDQFPSANNVMLLEDSVASFRKLFGFHTPWMMTFAYYRTRDVAEVKEHLSTLLPGIRLDDFTKLPMQQFAYKVHPIFVREYRRGLG